VNILTNINTLSKDDLQHPNGALDFTLLQHLRTDGVWSLGEVNMRPGAEFSPDQLREVHQQLGPGYVVAEDGCYTVINYTSVRSLTSYVSDYYSYYEQWFSAPTEPLDEPIAIPSFAAVPRQPTPTLTTERVSWVLNELRNQNVHDVHSLTVMTRSYGCSHERYAVDNRLLDSRISGICIEMFPNGANFGAWRINDLVRKTLDHGKKCYLLLPPELNAPNSNYFTAMRGLVDAVRQTGRLTDHRLYLVPSIYGTAGTTWFGHTNSIQSAIAYLKQQPEWHAEWPITRVKALAEDNWPASQLIDGSAMSPWSSKASSVADTRVEVSFWWDREGIRPVNYIRLRPRWQAGRALCFPVDFDLFYSNGAEWVPIRPIRNFPTPQQDQWVTIPLGQTFRADGIHVAATRLGPDDTGGFYFQLMEVAAGMANPVPS
jgi:hypothetical protein